MGLKMNNISVLPSEKYDLKLWLPLIASKCPQGKPSPSIFAPFLSLPSSSNSESRTPLAPTSTLFPQTLVQLTIHCSSFLFRLPHDPLNAIIPHRFVHLGRQKPKLYFSWLHIVLPSISYPITLNQKARRIHHNVRNLRWINHRFDRRNQIVHDDQSVFRCENQLLLIPSLQRYFTSSLLRLTHMHHRTGISESLLLPQHSLNG